MYKLLLILMILMAPACQAEPISIASESDRGSSSQQTETDTPMLMMPLSIISRPKNVVYEISYLSMNGSMVVSGSINGIPMQFVVDTGSSFVAIPPAIAEQAGLDASTGRKVRLQTANGVVSAPLVEIEEVVADRVSINNVLGVVQQVTPNPNLGLLGMSFFGKHKMTIDHERNTIVLEPKE